MKKGKVPPTLAVSSGGVSEKYFIFHVSLLRLLLLLARLSTNISQEEFDRLEAALSPIVHIGQDQVRTELSTGYRVQGTGSSETP